MPLLWTNGASGQGLQAGGAGKDRGREALGNQGEKDGPQCYSCQQKGHFANQCPSKLAMFCSQSLGQDGEPSRMGRVGDRAVEGIPLDTGAATTMVHSDLVPKERLTQETVDIRCAHGDVNR